MAVPELPHAGEELDDPAVEEREPDPDEIGDEARVVPAQDEGRQRERCETERSGVGSRDALDERQDRAAALAGGQRASFRRPPHHSIRQTCAANRRRIGALAGLPVPSFLGLIMRALSYSRQVALFTPEQGAARPRAGGRPSSGRSSCSWRTAPRRRPSRAPATSTSPPRRNAPRRGSPSSGSGLVPGRGAAAPVRALSGRGRPSRGTRGRHPLLRAPLGLRARLAARRRPRGRVGASPRSAPQSQERLAALEHELAIDVFVTPT